MSALGQKQTSGPPSAAPMTATPMRSRNETHSINGRCIKIGVAQITGANVTALRNRGSAAGKKR
jgi:hypothetical protein